MAKISIVGRGVDPSTHLSLFALRTIKSADKIIGIESELEFWKSLQSEFGIREIENVDELYCNQDHDLSNYSRFVNYVINMAKTSNHIALLVAGHPCLGVSFIEILKKEAAGIHEIEIIEGISSFDVMIKHLEIDPLEQGSVMLDVNRLLLFQYKLEPALSYFLYHASSIANSTINYLDPASINRIDLLINYLLKFYPKDKKVILCRMSNGKRESSRLIESTIIQLVDHISDIDYSTTLYLPPEKPNAIDWNYLDLLKKSSR